MNRLRAVAAWLLAALPGLARACPACFSADEDSQSLARVYNVSIGILLGATFGLMVAGGLWFRRMEQRREAAWDADSSSSSRPG